MALALLGLFLTVSVSEALECNPYLTKAGMACPSSCETASPGSPGEPEAPPSPTGHAGKDSACADCPFCLSPCAESPAATVPIDEHARRFAPPEYLTYYEAPSFHFRRPPRS
jgi:hypothetical protein